MQSNIYVHRYELCSNQRLNARTEVMTHEGALLRIDEDGASGYACLHPWVVLGDESLERLLNQLRVGEISQQLQCALDCARLDRLARIRGVSLFEGLDVPNSHATIVGGFENVALAVGAGFDTVKLKMGLDFEIQLQLLRRVHDAFPDLKMRLDFNAVPEANQISQFLEQCGESIRAQIDFIEDPFSFRDSLWRDLRVHYDVKFAIDREVMEAGVEYDVAVVKPAINDLEPIGDAAKVAGRKVVVTSYMDHPVGQSYAAFCAGKMCKEYAGVVDARCGLMTHGLLEPDSFTDILGMVKPEWNVPAGTGLGFDDLLENLNWTVI